MEIKDQAILVSGGASGIGATVSQHFAQQDAFVIVLDKDIQKAEQVANQVQGLALGCDVTQSEQLAEAFESIPTALKNKLKVNVNCAGVAPAQRMVGKSGPVDLDWFESVIKINLIGTFNVMRLVADIMIKNSQPDSENGVIINTASIAAFDGQIGQSAYSASKAGVVGMTLPLARELAQFGIRVMTIAPGLIETPMLHGLPEKALQHLQSQTVYPKRFGAPTEYALLAEQIVKNSMLNGEVIRLDGAMRMS